MILDYAIGRISVLRGNSASSGFNFKPVIRAVAQYITGTVTGSVRANTATGAGVSGATVEVLTAGSLLADNDPAVSTSTVAPETDRKSTRLNSSHLVISYAVFCSNKNKNTTTYR